MSKLTLAWDGGISGDYRAGYGTGGCDIDGTGWWWRLGGGG